MPANTLRINEIFYSIQGESTWAGCLCVFVRLTGCHLRCTYCDTEYAFKKGSTREIDSIIEEVCSHPCDLVEITGGEPLLQQRVHLLMSRLCDLGKTVLIETSGACDVGGCDPRVIRIMDIKTPGSGEAERNLWTNVEHLNLRDEVKFVITDHEDYLWARDVIRKHNLGARCKAVLLSPVFEQAPGLEIAGCESLTPRSLAEWMLGGGDDLPANVRMQSQLHKLIWEPQTRGV
jgi:7-carboxy-7-deazaguanine synthase